MSNAGSVISDANLDIEIEYGNRYQATDEELRKYP